MEDLCRLALAVGAFWVCFVEVCLRTVRGCGERCCGDGGVCVGGGMSGESEMSAGPEKRIRCAGWLDGRGGGGRSSILGLHGVRRNIML